MVNLFVSSVSDSLRALSILALLAYVIALQDVETELMSSRLDAAATGECSPAGTGLLQATSKHGVAASEVKETPLNPKAQPLEMQSAGRDDNVAAVSTLAESGEAGEVVAERTRKDGTATGVSAVADAVESTEARHWGATYTPTELWTAKGDASFEGFAKSLVHEVAWAVEDVAQRGVSRQSSGVLVFLFLLVLICGAISFHCCCSCIGRPQTSSNQRILGPLHQDIPQLEPDSKQMPASSSVMSGAPNTVDRSSLSPHIASSKLFTQQLDTTLSATSECVLIVPLPAPDGTFTICDPSGRAVLQASTKISTRKDEIYDSPCPLWKLALRTPSGEDFAYCMEVQPTTENSASATVVEFHILDAKAEYYASLVKLQLSHGHERFELTTHTGEKLTILRELETQTMSIAGDQGALLAATEPCQVESDHTRNHCQLRVRHAANTGLPLCALLCIGQVPKSDSVLASYLG